MDQILKKQQEMYDATWENGLAVGKEQRGALETNRSFIKRIDIIKQGMHVLEIGCGIGTIVNDLHLFGCDVVGIDIANKAIEYGQKKYPDIKLEVGVAEQFKFETESKDVVLSFDLFEHIIESDKHLDEVFRVLKPNGYYLLQTPNKYSNAIYSTIKSHGFGWKISHPSLHSYRELRNRFNKHGFNCNFIKMDPVNKFTLQKFNGLGPLKWIFKHLVFSRLPLDLQTNFYVVAKKR